MNQISIIRAEFENSSELPRIAGLQPARYQQAAKLVQPQSDTRLDCAQRPVELGGDLLVRQAAKVGQRDRLALRCRQFAASLQ